MRYGFIGCGNMGGAVARAVCRGVGPENVVLANRTPAKAEALAEALGCRAATNDVVAQDCDVIFLGVKPQMMADMLAGIAPILAKRSGRFVLVTMAAGLSMARVREMAGGAYPIIRIMPNTPVSLGAGMIQYCADGVSDDQAAFVVLSSIGLQGIRLAQPTLGESVAVIGAGLIGLMTIQLLVAQGCRVLAIDLDDSKLALARGFGAETCNAGAGEDPIAAGMAFSRGQGMDAVLTKRKPKWVA